MKVSKHNIEICGRVVAAYHEYLVEVQGWPAPDPRDKFARMIDEAVRRNELATIRSGISEVRQAAIGLTGTAEGEDFLRFMEERLGFSLESAIGDTKLYLKRIMRRGRISNEDEARFVMEILNDVDAPSRDDSIRGKLNEMLAAYETNARGRSFDD